MKALLSTGARVNRVDEEGEVELFCYALERTFAFRVAPAEASGWGAIIGRVLRVEVLDDAPIPDDLYECESCSKKPGVATLCRDCLERRHRAGRLWRGQRPSTVSSNETEKKE